MTDIVKQDVIEKKIYLIRGLNVMLDLKIAREYFLKKLISAIDVIHPENRIAITFPHANKYLKMRRAESFST